MVDPAADVALPPAAFSAGLALLGRLVEMVKRTRCTIIPPSHGIFAADERKRNARPSPAEHYALLSPEDILAVLSGVPVTAAGSSRMLAPPLPSSPGQLGRALLRRVVPFSAGDSTSADGVICDADRCSAKRMLDSAAKKRSCLLPTVAAEVRRVALDKDFFVVAHRVGAVLHALMFDWGLASCDVSCDIDGTPSIHSAASCPRVSTWSVATPVSLLCVSSGGILCATGAPGSEQHTTITATLWATGIGHLVAPLCFIYEDEETVYTLARHMYYRYWRWFHNPVTISTEPSSDTILRCLEMISAGAAQQCVDVTDRFRLLDIDLRQDVAVHWLVTWFAGFVPLSQALLIIDAVTASTESAAVLSKVALGVLQMRSEVIATAFSRSAVLELLFDLGDVEVWPLLLQNTDLVPGDSSGDSR